MPVAGLPTSQWPQSAGPRAGASIATTAARITPPTFSLEPLPRLAADLVICLPVVITEARQQGKPLDHHLAHLIVHGALHACGMDHQDDEGATAMEMRERLILKRFRIPDPYGTLDPIETSHATA